MFYGPEDCELPFREPQAIEIVLPCSDSLFYRIIGIFWLYLAVKIRSPETVSHARGVEGRFMYNAHFRFRESPFGATPDPQFYYSNAIYREAWATLGYGIESRKGFIVLTGEAGTGKTTLLKKAMTGFGSTVKTAYVPYTPFNGAELLPSILSELGLPASDSRSAIAHFSDYLIEQFRIGNIVALLIDEAQNLSLESLEELRCLGNLETAKDKLVQIVLAGQVELEQKLDQPALRQLKQRVALRSRLRPVAHSEVKAYMDSRLQVIGHTTEKLFDPGAIEKIACYSTGIPRLINIICDNALLIAYALSEQTVSAAMIDEVAGELRLGSSFKQKNQPRGGIKLPEERETARSAPEFLSDNKNRAPAVDEKPKNDLLINDSEDWSFAEKDAGPLSAIVNCQDAPKRRKPFIARRWFRPTITASVAIGLLTGLGIFLYPGESRFPLLGGRKVIKMIALIPSALEPESSAIITQVKLSAPQTQRLSTPDQDTSALIKEDPINVLLTAENRGKALDARAVRPEKPREAQPENRKESTNRAKLAVTGNSFVRSRPTANAKIITTLLPGTRIQVTGRMGEYYSIRSLDTKGVRGYVHKEDAFFGSAR
jgi:general secretion pathway protein A